MPQRLNAVAFDLDAASLISLREALPEWKIQVVYGATASSLTDDWNAAAADLLVVKARKDVPGTLNLCRFLAVKGSAHTQARRADAPLLVLVPPEQEAFVRALLEAGADSCLVLPINAKEVASMLVRARQGNQPGRHTLDLECAQTEDRWRDDGGQG
jgi:DNA-binding NarL/FixJ family response regulator